MERNCEEQEENSNVACHYDPNKKVCKGGCDVIENTFFAGSNINPIGSDSLVGNDSTIRSKLMQTIFFDLFTLYKIFDMSSPFE